ncbi:AEC family transporter [Mycoplasmopsis iners]|uniref:AEC family transporter n=1 Tax=Mycoplasmopsis iners TaxID=76630 RepID=UPI00049615C2|nr:AEC family transporter [Mycoplasmopsis iners]
MKETFIKLFSDQGMWGAVIATMTFILLGYFATKTKLFSAEMNNRLAKFGISFLLPFLTFSALMVDTNRENTAEIGIVLGMSIGFYVLFAIFTWLVVNYWPKLLPKWVERKTAEHFKKLEAANPELVLTKTRDAYVRNYQAKLTTSWLMIGYGSLLVFASPLVSNMKGSVFSDFTNALLQIWNIPFTFALFSYKIMQYSGEKLTKENIKPIIKRICSPMMILLFVSLFLWSLQWIPGLNNWYWTGKGSQPYALSISDAQYIQWKTSGTISANNVTKAMNLSDFHQFWGAFKLALPAFGTVLTLGAKIVSPVIWLVIGGSLALSNIKEAVKDKAVWMTVGTKLIILPAIMLGIVLLFVYPYGGKGLITKETGTLIILLMVTPPATTCVMYAVAYKHDYAHYTSQASALGTLLSIIAMPIWIVIANLTYTAIAG